MLGDQWKAIWATRNRIAHMYVLVDRQLIKQTVDHDLPSFHGAIVTMLKHVE